MLNPNPMFPAHIQAGGRSAARIIEDLLRYSAQTFPLEPIALSRKIYGLNPSVYPFNSIVYLERCPDPVVSDSIDGSKQVWYLILANTREHLEIHITAPGGGGTTNANTNENANTNVVESNDMDVSTVNNDISDAPLTPEFEAETTPTPASSAWNKLLPGVGKAPPPPSRPTLSSILDTARLHDFHLIIDDNRIDKLDEDPRTEIYKFICSRTSIELTLIIRPPEFAPEDLREFTPEKIQERFERYHLEKPSATLPDDTHCFNTLYNIIHQPLDSEEPKEIMFNNPTLNMRVNPAILCSKFHFSRDEQRCAYVPPNLHDYSNPETASLRQKFSRMLLESSVLTYQAASNVGSNHKYAHVLLNAVPFLQKALGCYNYAVAAPSISSNTSLSIDEYSFYISLGAVENFSDELIWERYNQQVIHDPKFTYLYLDALRGIAELRQSEDLEVKVMELFSLGIPTVNDVRQAYNRLDLDMESGSFSNNSINEDVLIDNIKQMIKEKPSSKSNIHESLKIILSTTSQPLDKIKQILEITDEMDVEQAYKILDIPTENGVDNITDEAIRVSFDFKALEVGEENDRLPKQALFTLAKSRNSSELLNYYESLTFGSLPDINLESACALLGIDENLRDENNIITIFQIRLKDTPNEVLELRQALRKVGENINSQVIPNYLANGGGSNSVNVADAADIHGGIWPVGLNNIGNTCYLNSLLQYYFTITPLRNAVLTFSESTNKEDLLSIDLEKKKVGGRNVPAWEVKRAQEFVVLLSKLFSEMINTKGKHVSPTKDLAYLALVPARDEEEDGAVAGEEEDKDKDIVVVENTEQITINDGEQEENPDVMIISSDSDAETDIEEVQMKPRTSRSSSSSELLVEFDKGANSEELNTPSTSASTSSTTSTTTSDVNKENEKPKRNNSNEDLLHLKKKVSRTIVEGSVTEESQPGLPQIIISETGKLPNKYKPTPVVDVIEVDSAALTPGIVTPGEEKARRIDSALFGRQQDVTECIENVLFQIEAAFKPSGYDEDGEQVDIIKDLFYGKTKQVLESESDGSNRRLKTERFSSLLVDVAEGPRDIYEALDSYFGEDIFELESVNTRRSVTISQLPPILQVQIQRVQFDRVLGRPFKSLSLLRFDETIYMDRYLDVDDAELHSKRREVFAWRVEIQDLKKQLQKLNSRQVGFLPPAAGLCPDPLFLAALGIANIGRIME